MSGRRARKNIIQEVEEPQRHETRHEEMSLLSVKWKSDKTHFTIAIKEMDSHVYGWFRKTRYQNQETAFAIDIFCKHKEEDYPVDSITYSTDPRTNLSSLNADIHAAVNRWLFSKVNGNFKTIDQLKKQAVQPTIRINRIASIDKIIMKLRECRDVAIRCGGSRLVQIHGDKEGEVPLNVVIDVTTQALALEGKVPSLELGSMMDRVIETGGTKRGERSPTINRNIAEPGNVKALVERLKHTKDKSEGRKLRALLRKMGHKGGSRSVNNGDAV
jgi:hypothetical protein